MVTEANDFKLPTCLSLSDFNAGFVIFEAIMLLKIGAVQDMTEVNKPWAKNCNMDPRFPKVEIVSAHWICQKLNFFLSCLIRN